MPARFRPRTWIFSGSWTLPKRDSSICATASPSTTSGHCNLSVSEKSSRKLPRRIRRSFSLLLCYITDRSQFSGDESARRRDLLQKIAEAARCGVDFIQLREKDLTTRELELLACEAIRAVRENSPSTTGLLINSRTDVALAVGADGVHLRSNDISPSDVRNIFGQHPNQ